MANRFEEALAPQDPTATVEDMSSAQPTNRFEGALTESTPAPDMSEIKAHITDNFAKASKQTVGEQVAQASGGNSKNFPTPDVLETPIGYGHETYQAKVAKNTIEDALQVGLGLANIGLMIKRPDILQPEDAGRFYRIAAHLTTFALDAPVMFAGRVMGGVAGTLGGAAAGALTANPLGIIGGALSGGYFGQGYGAMALPAAIRKMLMDHYERGNITSWSEFWDRTAATLIEANKEGIVGAATAGVAGAVPKLGALPSVAKAFKVPLVKPATVIASEIATMVTVGKALEGTVPKRLEDFADAASMVLVLHGIGALPKVGPKLTEMSLKLPDEKVSDLPSRVTGKLKRIYTEAGVPPLEVAKEAAQDPHLRQQLLAEGNQLPGRYGKFIDPLPDVPKPIEPDVSKGMMETSGGLLPQPEEKVSIEQPPRGVFDILKSERGSTKVIEGKRDPRTETEKKLDGWIRPSGEKEPLLDRMHDYLMEGQYKDTWNNFYENVVDRYDPFKRLVKQLTDSIEFGTDLITSKDAYKLVRLAVDSVGKAQHMLKFGTFDFDTLMNDGGPPLSKILEPINAERAEFNRFLVAGRHLEKLNQTKLNPETGKVEPNPVDTGAPITKEEAEAIVSEGKARYGKPAQELINYSNRVLKYLHKSGRISVEAYSAMLEANKNYVPFYRFTEDGGVMSGKKGTTSDAVKRLKGSKAPIVDPIESIVRNTFEYVRMAENNRAMLALDDLAQRSELGRELVKDVKQPVQGTEISPSEISRWLEDHGIEASPGTIHAFKVFRSMKPRDLRENQLAVWRDGKLQVKEVSPDVARAFQAMDGKTGPMNLALRLAAVPAKVLRGTLGFTPDFIVRNFLRDQVSAAAFSKYRGIPVVESLIAMGDLFQDSTHYQNWLKSGGTSGNFASIDRDYVERNVWELSKKTGLLDGVQNVVRHPLEMIRVGAIIKDWVQSASETVENATRLAEAKRVMGQNPTTDQIFEGGFAAREVTVDFQRRGALTQGWNLITAFWNANAQGLDRAARAFERGRRTETSIRIAVGITMPSVALWFWNHHDPRWKNGEIPQWQKDLFWIILIPGQTPIRIPKPYELGVLFGSLAERTLDRYWDHNPDGFKNFTGTALKGLLPNYMPTGLVGPIEHFAKRSTFTGHDLIPYELQRLDSKYQYTEYTSETAKLIGSAIQRLGGDNFGPEHARISSPLIVENYVRSFSGNAGMYLMRLTDQLLIKTGQVKDPGHAETPWARTPFMQAFLIQDPNPSAEVIQDFWEGYEKNETQINTVNHLIETGNSDGLKEYMGRINMNNMVSLKSYRKVISAATEAQKRIENSNMDPRDKRRQIDQLIRSKINIAIQGKKLIDALEARGKK